MYTTTYLCMTIVMICTVNAYNHNLRMNDMDNNVNVGNNTNNITCIHLPEKFMILASIPIPGVGSYGWIKYAGVHSSVGVAYALISCIFYICLLCWSCVMIFNCIHRCMHPDQYVPLIGHNGQSILYSTTGSLHIPANSVQEITEHTNDDGSITRVIVTPSIPSINTNQEQHTITYVSRISSRRKLCSGSGPEVCLFGSLAIFLIFYIGTLIGALILYFDNYCVNR